MKSEKFMLFLTVFVILVMATALIFSIVRICYFDFIPIIVLTLVGGVSFVISKIIQEVFW